MHAAEHSLWTLDRSLGSRMTFPVSLLCCLHISQLGARQPPEPQQAHGWRAAVITATEAPQLPISALRMRRRTAREGEGQPRCTEWPPVAHSLPIRVSAAHTPFPVQSPGGGAVPCTVVNLPWGMRTPSPVPQHAFAYKVDRRLSSALGEVASSHRPGESFMIDHQCPLWGGGSALPHVDLSLPASLPSSSVSWGQRCGSSGKEDHSKDSQSFDDQHP
jgi:hypothetical protein